MDSADYEKFYKRCLQCTDCGLREGATQVVPGDGDPSAKIMFIGEGPGAREDKLGKPFVGASGKFLDQMLSSIDLDREKVYIANMVKCRPPKNRDPSDEEKAICRKWLDRQLELVNPKIIIPLGRHALGKFVPGIKISEAHGRFFTCEVDDPLIKGKIIFASYHPAVALYNGSMRETLINDFANLKKVLEKL